MACTPNVAITAITSGNPSADDGHSLPTSGGSTLSSLDHVDHGDSSSPTEYGVQTRSTAIPARGPGYTNPRVEVGQTEGCGLGLLRVDVGCNTRE